MRSPQNAHVAPGTSSAAGTSSDYRFPRENVYLTDENTSNISEGKFCCKLILGVKKLVPVSALSSNSLRSARL